MRLVFISIASFALISIACGNAEADEKEKESVRKGK